MDALEPITVRRYGRGAGPVALLHGGPGAPGYLAPLARDLGREFDVQEPLQRLSGSVQLSVARHVADLAAVLDAPAVLIGHSWGAMLALSFACAHPGRVRALMLVACGTYDTASRSAYQAAMRERMGEAILGDTPEQFAELARLATRAQAFDPLPRGDEVIAYDPAGYRETWGDAKRLQEAGIEPAAFSAITVPACMVHGDADPHPGLSTHATLVAHMPQLDYIELARCGHEPWNERHGREPFRRLVFEQLKAWLVES